MTAQPPSIPVPDLGVLEGLAQLHQTLIVVDQDGTIAWAAGELEGWFDGGTCVVGRNVRELFHSSACHERFFRRLAREGCFANERVELARDGGVPLALDLSVVPVAVGGGGRAMNLAIVRPAEAAATPEAGAGIDFFRAILESSVDALLAVDRRGYVTYANPAFERLLGEPVAFLLDKPVTLVLSGRAELEAIADALRPGLEGASAELRLSGPARDAVLTVSTRELRLPDGTQLGAVAFFRDVTTERRFEEALERKNQELEHYVHAVSHDLRTPLVSLLGFSRLLAQDYADALDGTGLHFLERIEQASRTMEALTNDLLDLSRIGRSAGLRELVDPRSVLQQLAHELKPRFEESGIELCLPDSPPKVACVRTHLYRVFSNLLINAIEHLEGGEAPRIAVQVADERDAHVLCVRDNGPGVPPESHERVFEIFHTLGRKPSGRKGTGVGLAIVRKIAEAHGGRVWLESEPGKGAAFYVSLPRS